MNLPIYGRPLQIPRFIWLFVVLLVGVALSLSPSQYVYAASFEVNSALDTVDISIGNGVCADSDGNCTLRAAIQETNALSGADVITFNSGLDGTPIVLTRTTSGEDAAARGDLDITSSLTISGNGVSNTIIDANSIDRVFQIFSGITVTFDDLTIKGGSRPDGSGTLADAGAGVLSEATTTFNRARITGNIATYRGGGLYNWGGTMIVNASVIDANSSGTSGGGIFSEGTLTVTNSTISSNNAGGNGGGLFTFNGSSATLNYTTVAKNMADSDNTGSENGGGISQFTGTTLSILSSLIADNTIGTSGGSGPDCSGTITSLDYNVVEQGTVGCTVIVAGNDNLSPAPFTLAALADNGGPTLTHALVIDSPAIDLIPDGANGCNTIYTTDQRGFTRPIDADGNTNLECDVGALESLQACQVAEGSSYTLQDVTFDVPSGGGGDIACFLVTAYSKNHPNAPLALQTGAYWQLEAFDFSGGTASGYSINLSITVSFTPDSVDTLCRYTGSGWDCAADNVTGSVITRNSITQLSPWTGGDNAGPTAITLQTLTARSAATPLAMTVFALFGAMMLLAIWRKRDEVIK